MAWTVLRRFLLAALKSTDGREAERVFHDCMLAVWFVSEMGEEG